MLYTDNNVFRKRRGFFLARLLQKTAVNLGRSLNILDVGGRPDYWNNVGYTHIQHIECLNHEKEEFLRYKGDAFIEKIFSFTLGDACDLSQFPDQSVDFVHSNSVIEHVGEWSRMVRMAREVQRVGRAGWIQTPAWEFPIEPHYRLPFMHWLARPAQTWLVYYSPPWRGRRNDLDIRRRRVERVNLVSKSEFRALFPAAGIFTERLVFAKSYAAYWDVADSGM